MPGQAISDFSARVQSAVAAGERLAGRLAGEVGSTEDISSTPEYQELVRLKVIIELETSRTLSETAEIAAALEERDLLQAGG
jgi:hypothetical protein